MDDEKKKSTGAAQPRNNEKLSRREAMKRMAKGIALVGTLGVAGVVTQGQDECSGSYVNGYYNYSNAYYNYSYYNYANMYTAYSEYYYNYYDYYNYYNYYNYSDYQNYYDYSENYSNIIWGS